MRTDSLRLVSAELIDSRSAPAAGEAAVDGEELAGDVAGAVAQEEDHRLGHLPGGALAAEGHGGLVARRAAAGRRARPSGRVDEAGGDDVGPDPAAGALGGDLAAQPGERATWTSRRPGCGCRRVRPAIDEMNTIDPPSGIAGERGAARAGSASATLTANTCVPLLGAWCRPCPCRRRCRRCSTSPSSPPIAASAAVDERGARRRRRSRRPRARGRWRPRPRTSATVAAQASASMSAQATVAPSRPATTAMARPLPTGASGSSVAPGAGAHHEHPAALEERGSCRHRRQRPPRAPRRASSA